MLPKSYLKIGESTIDKGCVSSIMYSASKFCSRITGIECLFNIVGKAHCLFDSPSLQSPSVLFLHFLFSGFSFILLPVQFFMYTIQMFLEIWSCIILSRWQHLISTHKYNILLNSLHLHSRKQTNVCISIHEKQYLCLLPHR